MNVVKGGIGNQKTFRNNGGNRSMLTSKYNQGNIGLFTTSRLTNSASRSLSNKVRSSTTDAGLNSTQAWESMCHDGCVMGPPSAPPLSGRLSKRKGESMHPSQSFLNATSTSASSTSRAQNNGPTFLDLSQAKGVWTPKYGHPYTGPQTSSTSRGINSMNRTKPTPCSSTSNTTSAESCIVLALCEGRGLARGEVGLAAIDLRRPSLTLCQLSDSHSYIHTMTALHFFTPVEIIVPSTFCENTPTELYRVVRQSLSPNIPLTAIQRRHFSDTQGLHYINTLCAPEYASVELQLIHKFYALTAAAAVIKYVEYIQCVVFQQNSLKVEYHCSKNYTWIDVETAIRLELVESLSGSYERGSSLLSIVNHCHTAGGARALRASILQPPSHHQVIQHRADAVQELLDNSDGLMPSLQSVMRQLYDVDKVLWLCMELPSQGGCRAGEAQLNHTILLKNTMDLVPHLISALDMAKSHWFINAKKDLENPKFVEINERIKRVIHDSVHASHGRDAQQHRCFAVKPEINGLLDVARRSYSELVSDIQERVEELGKEYNLPLRLCKTSNRGFHISLYVGTKNKRTFSDTDLPDVFIEIQNHGSNVTMTTEEIALLDQQANEALNEIQTMSNIVIFGLLTELRPYMSVLYKLCEHVAELDVILSLAQVSSSGHYVRPVFGDHLDVRDSIHPMLDYLLPVPAVSNHIFASPECNFNIITGPNMGGKTIYIKQIALLQIMSQIGCFVPATSATFRLSDKIFTRIGFNDSIECNASTYILEMKEIQHILQTITPTSLVIVDELCRGTSSEEGTSMSWAICERLIHTSAFTFFTTHFLYLTRLYHMYYNVVNLHMIAEEVCNPLNEDRKQLVYKHKVSTGVTTLQHYGLTLATNTNLPKTLVSLARELAQVVADQKKPMDNPIDKCSQDVLLCRLGAELIRRTRDPECTDQDIQQIIGQFTELHQNIVASTQNQEISIEITDEEINDDPDRSNIATLSHEDPMIPINIMRNSQNRDLLNCVDDAQAIVTVSRNSSRSTTNSFIDSCVAEDSNQTTPVPRKNVENQLVIDDSDLLIPDNEQSMQIDIEPEIIDNRFKRKRVMEDDKEYKVFMSQPSTSKGVGRSFFRPPFKTSEIQNQYEPFDVKLHENNPIEIDLLVNEFSMDDEHDELLSQIDENSPSVIRVSNQRMSCNVKSLNRNNSNVSYGSDESFIRYDISPYNRSNISHDNLLHKSNTQNNASIHRNSFSANRYRDENIGSRNGVQGDNTLSHFVRRACDNVSNKSDESAINRHTSHDNLLKRLNDSSSASRNNIFHDKVSDRSDNSCSSRIIPGDDNMVDKNVNMLHDNLVTKCFNKGMSSDNSMDMSINNHASHNNLVDIQLNKLMSCDNLLDAQVNKHVSHNNLLGAHVNKRVSHDNLFDRMVNIFGSERMIEDCIEHDEQMGTEDVEMTLRG